MLFGAISGSAVAAASAIGGIMTEGMVKDGYPRPFTAGVNISSSSTGLVIPPSNALIVYAWASGGAASVAALVLAVYVPGILVGLGWLAVGFIYSRRCDLARGGRAPCPEVW